MVKDGIQGSKSISIWVWLSKTTRTKWSKWQQQKETSSFMKGTKRELSTYHFVSKFKDDHSRFKGASWHYNKAIKIKCQAKNESKAQKEWKES